MQRDGDVAYGVYGVVPELLETGEEDAGEGDGDEEDYGGYEGDEEAEPELLG